MATEVRLGTELPDELLAGHDAKTVHENDGLLDELTKPLAERILNAELDHHLGQDNERAVGNVHPQRQEAEAVLDNAAAWRARPPEPVYAIVFFDCLRIKIRDDGTVKNKAYLAIGMRCPGDKSSWASGSSKPRGPSSGCG